MRPSRDTVVSRRLSHLMRAQHPTEFDWLCSGRWGGGLHELSRRVCDVVHDETGWIPAETRVSMIAGNDLATTE